MKKIFLCIVVMQGQVEAINDDRFLESCKNTVKGIAEKIQHVFYKRAARLGAFSRINICQEGPIEGMPELHYAVLTGKKSEVMGVLLQQGTSIEVVDSRGITALHWAAFKGFYDIVEYLIERGASIECQDNNGWRPLHYAAVAGHYEIVKYLIKQGADKTASTKTGARAWWITEDRRIESFLGGDEEKKTKVPFVVV